MIEHRGYVIHKAKQPSLYCIMLPGKGGSLADSLSGLFTTPLFAKRAIDLHLDTKKPTVKKKQNDEQADSGGSN